MNEIWREVEKIPRVTRFITLSSISITILSFFVPAYLGMHTSLVIPQFWRAYTSLFIFPSSIGGLFDLLILFKTSSDLEGSGMGRAGAGYAWSRIIDALFILLLNYPINAFSLFRSFFLSVVYTQSILSPNSHVSLFGLVSIPNYAYPYVILAIDLLIGGPVIVLFGLMGIIAAHFRHTLSIFPSPVPALIRNTLTTPPQWFEKWWISSESRERHTGFGTAINPTQSRSQPHNWGGGRRLAD